MFHTITIRNFKSYRDVTLELGKINTVVGPNGSGKTNLIDAFSFLKQVLRPTSLPPYPFARWGDYRSVVFMQDPDLDISFQLSGKYRDREFRYEITLNGKYAFVVKEEKIRLDSHEIVRQGNTVDLEGKRAEVPENMSLFNMFTRIGDIVMSSLPPLPWGDFLDFMLNFFNDVMILRSTENALSPVHISFPEGLREDGMGLPRILLGKPLPKQVSEFLNSLNLAVRTTVTEDGNVRLYAEENVNGKQITISSTPSGVVKMLTLMVGVYMLKPSLVVVDELENSLHLRFVERLIDVMNYSAPQFLVTTHSPMVMDFMDPSEIILLDREMGETKPRRFENPEELRRNLREKGLTLSEWIIY
ncbi:AAA family ATPase [Metallosphaera javensis (ex Sakai et al. 2022)]|uniref:AAA family ATPase n=1 Tax=Metallosphaera javensis (ex Sakai et al. 2022) TaxID=2775498 RepID=UPI00258D3FE1|nr:MAG: chromosome partition protein Smc [Metallosphaera javensis (ex Sakai et al. 2022)]